MVLTLLLCAAAGDAGAESVFAAAEEQGLLLARLAQRHRVAGRRRILRGEAMTTKNIALLAFLATSNLRLRDCEALVVFRPQWSTAGRSADFGPAGQWRADAVPRELWPVDDPAWDATWGDRQTTLVLIGQAGAPQGAAAALEARSESRPSPVGLAAPLQSVKPQA